MQLSIGTSEKDFLVQQQQEHNADDNGQGLFAYDVPAGFYALNTKNLEAYG